MRLAWGCCARARARTSFIVVERFSHVFLRQDLSVDCSWSCATSSPIFWLVFFPLSFSPPFFLFFFSFFELLFNSFLNHCSCSRLWESNFALRDACYILYIYTHMYIISLFFFFFPSLACLSFFFVPDFADHRLRVASIRRGRIVDTREQSDRMNPGPAEVWHGKRSFLHIRWTDMWRTSGKQNRIKTVPREASRSARMHFSSDTYTHTHLLIVTRFTHIHTIWWGTWRVCVNDRAIECMSECVWCVATMTHIETIITVGFSESRVDWEIWQCEQSDYKVGERESEREKESAIHSFVSRCVYCIRYIVYNYL